MALRTYSRVESLQPLLADQVLNIAERLKVAPLMQEILGVLLTGSCARGEATYRSDIDFLVILRDPPLNYSRVTKLRAALIQSLREAVSILDPYYRIQDLMKRTG